MPQNRIKIFLIVHFPDPLPLDSLFTTLLSLFILSMQKWIIGDSISETGLK